MNKYKGKKLLVLGGSFQHCKVVEAAHRLGVIVYVTDYLETSPAKNIADVSYKIDINDIEGLVKLCISEHINGAIATSLDPCQIPYQKLCERMNFPCFGTKEQYYILTNKHAFKKCCNKYGVDTIPSYTLSDIFESKNDIEYPVIVKPSNSRGSRGQSICNSKEKVLEAIKIAKKEDSNENVIIEKYMEHCDDFTISYLFVDGQAILVRTGDRYQGSKDAGLNKIAIASASPSKYTELYLNHMHNKVISMLKEIGIVNGPVFMQGFVDGDIIRFYDPGLRFAGGEYERLLKITSGIDIIELLVNYALSGKINDNKIPKNLYSLCGKRIMQLCPTIRAGKIAKICGIEKLKENPCIITYSPRYKIGDKIDFTYDVRQRFAEICILSDDIEHECWNIHFIHKYLKVFDEYGEQMLYDLFDTNRLQKKGLI